jgi:hypothetical protein
MFAAIGLFDVAWGAELAPVSSGPRTVAEVPLAPNCQRIWSCHGELCHWRNVCWHGCTDRYSCSPLYGAYGPYGGPAYWGAYSYGDLPPY